MAETLGSLCDKLTIVKLKQWHTEEESKLSSLTAQEKQLQTEIDEFIIAAACGQISFERLIFVSNKVYKREGNDISEIGGTFGEIFSKLAQVNCELWHEQEKVYEFEKIPIHEKDKVVKQLATLNLARNQCIDEIDKNFQTLMNRQ